MTAAHNPFVCKQLHFPRIKGLGVRGVYALAADNNGRTIATPGSEAAPVPPKNTGVSPNKDLPRKKGGVITDYAVHLGHSRPSRTRCKCGGNQEHAQPNRKGSCMRACAYACVAFLNASYCHRNALLMTQGQCRPRMREPAFIYA
ncbi:hypothetical protein DBV15_08914 [Temnothorax longispinosus]|uniref:Uncharacterized protein n=1 Tax=Temnothorax longispinosus TaxID=300112 RepID=A0A4S2KFA4_9HYME|nr:hypothetical protein DBV15_08914 [Temnothorax longispinosus]